MPYMKNGKRDYKREYKKYHASEEQKTNRADRNNARSRAEDAGLARKGDGKDVDHSTPLSKGGSNSESNLKVVPKSKNRSFSRNKDSSVKSQRSKRERKRGD
jgi:hypothetical protein